MDLTIKAKPCELEALNYLDQRAPEIYKGKKQGLYWAVHEAALEKEIDWERYAKIKLEEYFPDDNYKDKSPLIIHLTADEDEYNKVALCMKEFFSLQRPVQKAYCIRNIIKYAVATSFTKDNAKTCHIEVKLDDEKVENFSQLSVEDRLEAIYKELLFMRKLMEQR